MQKFFLILFLLCFPAFLFSQKISFEFDYAQFAYDTLSNYIEFYYSFDQRTLSFINTDTSDYLAGILHIEISDSAKPDKVVDKQWLLSNEIKDSSELNRNLVGVLGFILHKGSYRIVVTATDANDSSSLRTITENVTVNPFIKQTISLSDIQLAGNILPGSENTFMPDAGCPENGSIYRHVRFFRTSGY